MDFVKKQTLPSVLFVSSCQIEAVSVIEKLVDRVPSPISQNEEMEVFPWHINSKYYDTDVHLIVMKKKKLIPPSFVGDVQGIVLLFDSCDESAIERLCSWYDAYLVHYDAYVKILLCKKIDDENPRCIKKVEVLQWCLKRGFELVELEPIVDEEWEAEQDFHESTGILRVKQALTAHYWPNLILKDPRLPTSMDELLHGGRTPCTNIGSHPENNSKSEDIGAGSVDSISLESLTFKDVLIMRDQAMKLPRCEKQKFAEKIVYTLWSAIPDTSDSDSDV